MRRHLGASLHGQNFLQDLVLLHELLFMSFCFMSEKLYDSIHASFQFLMPDSCLKIKIYIMCSLLFSHRNSLGRKVKTKQNATKTLESNLLCQGAGHV
jgi:hypothetical protein